MTDEPVFRKRTAKKPPSLRRNTPKADGDEESGNEGDVGSKITDIAEVQKARQRRGGMSAVECAVGKQLAKEFGQMEEDPWRMRGGGMLRLSGDRRAALTAADIEHDIKGQFKKETLLRDENEEMRKYIDSKLDKPEGEQDPDIAASSNKRAKLKSDNPEDVILFKAAERVKGYVSKSSNQEELLSNQMLVGIPEVDLGIDARISNIWRTERKKTELLGGSKAKPKDPPKGH